MFLFSALSDVFFFFSLLCFCPSTRLPTFGIILVSFGNYGDFALQVFSFSQQCFIVLNFTGLSHFFIMGIPSMYFIFLCYCKDLFFNFQ